MAVSSIMESGSSVRVTEGPYKGSWGWYQFTASDGLHDVAVRWPEKARARVEGIIQISAKDLSREEFPSYLEDDLGHTETDRDFLVEFWGLIPLGKTTVEQIHEELADARKYLENIKSDLAEVELEIPEILKLNSQITDRWETLDRISGFLDPLLDESKRIEKEPVSWE